MRRLLELPAASLLNERLENLLPEFAQVYWLDETSSTNSVLMEQARKKPDTKYPILLGANFQTQGRGRLGRQWNNVQGRTLMFSCALELGVSLDQLAIIAPLAGLIACEVLRTRVPSDVRDRLTLKWPNDLLFDDAKLSGILVESVRHGGDASKQVVVIGMGLNLTHAQELSQALNRKIADWGSLIGDSVNELPQIETYIASIVASIAQSWLHMAREFETDGFSAFQARYRDVDALKGKMVTVFNNDQILLSGKALGLDEQARLLLETETGVMPVISGDISVRAIEN